MTNNSHRYPTQKIAAHAAGIEGLAIQIRRTIDDADPIADQLDHIAETLDDVSAQIRNTTAAEEPDR